MKQPFMALPHVLLTCNFFCSQKTASENKNTMKKKLLPYLIAPTLTIGLAHGATTLFGSDNEGLGGFTQSSLETGGAWDTNPDSVGFTQINDSLNNNSFLKEYILDRSVGNSYEINGTLTWSAEADRNNRQGIYLFGDVPDLTAVGPPAGPQQNEAGAISFLLNADVRQILVSQGIDNGVIGTPVTVTNAPTTNTYFTDQVLTFRAEIDFVNNGGIDQIEMAFTLFDSFVGSDTTPYSSVVTVDAADYTGNYFGFAGRTRDDGGGDSIANYNSFSVIPEPSSAMLAGLLGTMALLRRRT